MATTTLYPDGTVFTTTGLTGGVSTVDSAPDGTWLTTNASNSTLRASFATPPTTLNTGTNLQTFRVYVRKDAAGGGDPLVDIHLYENGTDLGVLLADTLVTSSTGVWVSVTWSASSLTSQDGSNVEIYCDGTKGGGGPNERNIEFDSIEWIADYTPFAGTLSAESGSYSTTGSAAEFLDVKVLAAESGSYAVTGSAATLGKGVTLAAESGSYSVTGSAADFILPLTGSGNNTLFATDTDYTAEPSSFDSLTASSGFTVAPTLSDLENDTTWTTATSNSATTSLRFKLASSYPRRNLVPSCVNNGFDWLPDETDLYQYANAFEIWLRTVGTPTENVPWECHAMLSGVSQGVCADGVITSGFDAGGLVRFNFNDISKKWAIDFQSYSGGGSAVQDHLRIDDYEFEIRFNPENLTNGAVEVRSYDQTGVCWMYAPKVGPWSTSTGHVSHITGSGDHNLTNFTPSPGTTPTWGSTYLRGESNTTVGTTGIVDPESPTNFEIYNPGIHQGEGPYPYTGRGFSYVFSMLPLPEWPTDPDQFAGRPYIALLKRTLGVTALGADVGGASGYDEINDSGQEPFGPPDPPVLYYWQDSGSSSGGTGVYGGSTYTNKRYATGWLWGRDGNTSVGYYSLEGVKYLYMVRDGFNSDGDGVSYTHRLDAESGSYSLTGSAVAFDYSGDISPLLANAGSYALTGSAAEFQRGYRLAAESGSYSYTGSAATLTHSLGAATLDAESGSYTVTGSDADLLGAFVLETQVTGIETALCLSGSDGFKFWLNDANAIDGSTSTFAENDSEGFVLTSGEWTRSNPIPIGTYASNHFRLYGAIPPANAQANTISKVRYRIYCEVTGSGTPQLEVVVFDESASERDASSFSFWTDLQRDHFVQTTAGWTDWTEVAPPVGGWATYDPATWPDPTKGLIRLEMAGQDPTGTMTLAKLYTAEVEYTYTDAVYTTSFDGIIDAADLILPTDAGAYSYTGSDADFYRGYSLQAESGSYACTGSDADIARTGTLLAEAGSYAYTGSEVAFPSEGALSAAPGAYTYSGEDVQFVRDLKLSAESGTYSLTGEDAELDVTFYLPLESGSYTYTGSDADIARTGTLLAEAGAYTYTGADAAFDLPRVLLAEDSLYNIFFPANSMKRALVMPAESGVYNTTGADAAFPSDGTLSAAPGSYSYTGADAELARIAKLSAEAGSYITTGADALFDLATDYQLAANAGTYALTGSDATLSSVGIVGRRVIMIG